MPRTSLTLRAFIALLLAALPPLAVLLVVDALDPSLRDGPGFNLVGLGVLAGSIGWVAIVAIVAARMLGLELRQLVDLAERGRPSSVQTAAGDDGELDARSRRMAETLTERNRQMAELAAQANVAPISDEPRQVAGHVVATVRGVTGDQTWSLAILEAGGTDSLPPGVYGAAERLDEPIGLTDLYRWASVTEPATSGYRVRRSEGPWGAFVIVEVASHDRLRAILLAPWEGRADPSSAEVDLLSLVGQHAATAIEHALLYTTVRSQADELDRLGTIQRDFLRAVSHDLQTPLASIRALASELQSRSGSDVSAGDDLDMIAYQADRLRRMVQQLLAMSRLEAGVLEPRQEVLSPRAIVERVWSALRITDRRFAVTVSGPSLLLVADPDRLEQVLWAVLDNAVKYSPPGTPIEVGIGAAGASAERAIISIRDHGPGMDAESADRAFEQFYRSPQAQRIAPDGTGIGLYTARGLVEAMGGSVAIASALGHGTTVSLELPAEPVEESTAASPIG